MNPGKNSISAVAIRRHIGTLMLALALIVLGIFFAFRLQVDLLPAITYPRIGLVVNSPGVSPEVALEEITKPLEEALGATEGVVQIYSRTREGRVRLNLFFEPGGDIDRALSDATASFNRNRDSLPNLVTGVRLFKFAPSQLPIYEFALESASLDDLALRIFADEELSRELNLIPGVASVDVTGGLTEEVRVEVDLKRLQAFGLSFNEVLDALSQRNIDIAGGRLKGGEDSLGEPLIRTVGKFQSAEEIANLTLDLNSNDSEGARNQIYLRDIAEIIDGNAEQRVFVTLNGEPAVKITLQKQPDANTVKIVEQVEKKLQQLRKSGLIAADMKLVTTRDESVFIRNSISNVAIAGLLGTLLAALVVFFFLGSLRQTFIIVMAIPLATLTAIILMKLFGLSINIFSLGGLALGVGIVVDNSIVMLENIGIKMGNRERGIGNRQQRDEKTRKQEDKERRKLGIEQAIIASQEVESALIASTATNLVAVLPFLLIGGLFSLLFRELILTISFAIAASLLLGLTIVPMLASRLLNIPISSKVNQWNFLVWFNQGFAGLTYNYRRFLDSILRYRLVVIVLAFTIIGFTSYTMLQNISQEILPKINTGQAFLVARFPPGTNLPTNQRVMEKVDAIIQAQPETAYAFTTVGGFLFGNNTVENMLRSSSNITLHPGTNLDSFITKINREFRKLNLVDIRLRIFPGTVRGLNLNNSPVKSKLDLILQSKDLRLLEETGEQVLKILDEKATLSRFRSNLDPKQLEIRIVPDSVRLADTSLTIQNLGRTVQRAIAGAVPTQLQRDERLIDIRVQLDGNARQSISQLQKLPILAGRDHSVALTDVANLELGEAPGEIQRIDRRSVYMMLGSLNEGATLSDALAELDSIVQDIDLPDGITVLPSYAARSNQEIQSALKALGGLAVFLVFVVMAVQYNSLIDPLVILLTVPLALAGGIFGLFITDTAIGATVLVGVVLLVGIVVNNAIVMVELANQLYSFGKGSRQAVIVHAAATRLRPILMTTITTVLGMFPLAIGIGEGSEFLQPLGIVVFSGLVFATLLTLFIIPCFYVLLHQKSTLLNPDMSLFRAKTQRRKGKNQEY
ncbi:cation/multidrug efflux pump [Xenococcus sp. PCC 7305]|uniref:efflux RND transporter permease subunit n=1 Tax=Xenococcus sp. PCC 7305 TaxID=102125 RepID=UPI0002ACCEEA|nr:efflux RND transporter permease subunit [Xenococcus sp. PCC 7305]ELS04547.1 cation/multidrug efflux pump [Xenococcus sp. PCC 7305]